MSVTVADVYDYIDSFAPFSTQLSFDNAGLLAGRKSAPADRIGVCLDITSFAVQTAAGLGAQLIVSHHPVIFNPLKNLLSGSPAYELAANGISAICAHTNLDAADGGINDVLCGMLGLENVIKLDSDEQGFPPLCRAGDLPGGKPLTARELSALCAGITDASGARFCDAGRPVKRVAVCTGAGGDFIGAARDAGAQALVSGDIRYHEMLEGLEAGVSVIDFGHFASENIIVPVLIKRLSERFPGALVFSLGQTDPIEYI